MTMKVAVLTLLLLAPPTALAFLPAPISNGGSGARGIINDCNIPDVIDDDVPALSGVQNRRAMFKTGSLIAATLLLGTESNPARAEEKVYSANARNMARLSSGDSSGGSIYDNNPSSPKARARRAMVGCKNGSARSLAGERIGKRNLVEKECNQLVMGGDSEFMLGALTELDCPTCPYGIGSR